jgi:hypothetical protein
VAGSGLGRREDEVGRELVAGVRVYFDRALGKMLLYRFERQQYAALLRDHGADARMSDLYGGEHLLRLLGVSGTDPARTYTHTLARIRSHAWLRFHMHTHTCEKTLTTHSLAHTHTHTHTRSFFQSSCRTCSKRCSLGATLSSS